MNIMKKNVCVCAGVIITNFILFLIKLYIGLYTGSICIYTDAVNNLTDSLISVIALAGFCFLLKAKNRKYPFGYGRIQDLVSLLMSAVVIAAGLSFAYSALERLFYPMPVMYWGSYVAILTMTAIVKLIVAVLLHFYVKKNPSPVISDMRLDSTLDFFISSGTVLSFTISEYSGLALDGIMGLIVSTVIIISGIKILSPAVKMLLGRRNDRLCDNVQEYISSFGCEVTDVQCHLYGNEKIFTARIKASDDMCYVTERFRAEYGCELYVTSKEKEND